MRILLLGIALAGALHAQSLPAPDAQVLLRTAIGMAGAGSLDDAERLLLEGRRRFPDDTRFPQELAGVEYRRKNPSAAKNYLRAALRLAPRDAYAADFLGSLYLLDGNLPAALEYWNRIDKPLLDRVRFAPEPALDPLLRDRALAVSAGQMLTLERLRRTEANLMFLGVFSDWRFDLVPQPNERSDLTIRLSQRGLPVSGWPRLLLPLRGLPYRQVNLDWTNLGRRAVNFNSLWRWDPQKRRVALALSGPLANWRYRWMFDARDERWELRTVSPAMTGLKLRRAELGGDLERILTEKLMWTVGLRIAGRRFHNGDGSSTLANGWTAAIRNRFDYLLYDRPENRLRVDAFASLDAGRIYSRYSSRLVSPEGGIAAKWMPQASGSTYSVAAELRTGAAFGSIPLDKLFILGMERDNDLWLRGHLGASEGRKGSAPMGTRFVLARTELDREVLRLPFLRFAAGPFFDVGRVGGHSRFGSRGWLYDTGLQAKIGAIAGLKFTAVYGRNLRDGSGVFYTAITR